MTNMLPGRPGWKRGLLAAACAAALLAPCAAQADIAAPRRLADGEAAPSVGMKMLAKHWDASTGKPALQLPSAAEAMAEGGGAWLRRSTPMLELSIPGPYRWTWTLSKNGDVLASGAGEKAGPGFETAYFDLPQAAACTGGCLLDAVFVPVRCSAGSGKPVCRDSEDGAGMSSSLRLSVEDGVLLLDGSPLDESIPMQAKVVAARDADGAPEMKTLPWRGPLPPGVPELETETDK